MKQQAQFKPMICYSETPPKVLHAWLLEPGSLTMREKRLGKDVQVQLLNQSWQVPTLAENKLLKMRGRCLAWLRQVHLHCDGELYWFARVVLPRTLLVGEFQRFGHWGDRPLGEILFNHPLIQRRQLHFAALRPRHVEFEQANRYAKLKRDLLWARRSVFECRGEPLVITEVFLKS